MKGIQLFFLTHVCSIVNLALPKPKPEKNVRIHKADSHQG
jgi:hypothetical protein